MNDTHGVEGEGWYGFDLDGTLAVYDKWEGIDHIGEPVKPMVDLVKRMHAEGKVVKILTARVSPRTLEDGTIGIQRAMVPLVNLNKYLKEPKSPFDLAGNRNTVEINAKQIIELWCEKHLGFVPEITHEKDHLMLELYDDRVKQVLPNKGVLMEDIAIREARENVKLECSYMARFGSFSNGFLLGMFAVAVIVIGVEVWVSYHRTPAGKALDNLRSAIIEVQEALK